MFQKSLYILSAILFLAISSPTDNRREFEISRNLEIFAQVYKELNGGFVDEIDPGKLMRTGITAMVASLDPFTNYYQSQTLKDIEFKMKENPIMRDLILDLFNNMPR
jgi:carboxyl-terminal processing protease